MQSKDLWFFIKEWSELEILTAAFDLIKFPANEGWQYSQSIQLLRKEMQKI